MCGFFSIIYKEDSRNIGNVMTKAGFRLTYRGYDSTGAGVIDSECNLTVRKDKGSIEDVSERYNFSGLTGNRGIIQLRWATYGKPSKENSQPHLSCDGELMAAHNGNIINSHKLRATLTAKGHKFLSVNDGEIVPHIIEDNMNASGDLVKAAVKSYKQMVGDYAFVITKRTERKMYAAKKGSSMFVGIGDDFICASSDLYAILDNTKKILSVNDGEMVVFDCEDYQIYSLVTGRKIQRKAVIQTISPEDVYKEPYRSFMEKEIHEIPNKINALINYYTDSDTLEGFAKLAKGKHILITGSGTSYNAAFMGLYFLNRMSNKNVTLIYPSEINDRLKHVNMKDTLLVAVSQSGETKDIKNAVDTYRKNMKGKVVAVVNNMGSTLAMNSDFRLPTMSDMEVAVPATKTFINQVVLFYVLSCYIMGKSKEQIKREGKSIIKAMKSVSGIYSSIDPEIINILSTNDRMHILGYSLTHPVAMEGALKMKEVNYINVEAMHSSEFKHGPLALITEKYPIILITSSSDKHYTLSHINEIQTRDGIVITVSQNDKDIMHNSDYSIAIPVRDENIFAMAAVYLLQMLSMHIAYEKGIDPDKPRNISKTITVD